MRKRREAKDARDRLCGLELPGAPRADRVAGGGDAIPASPNLNALCEIPCTRPASHNRPASQPGLPLSHAINRRDPLRVPLQPRWEDIPGTSHLGGEIGLDPDALKSGPSNKTEAPLIRHILFRT